MLHRFPNEIKLDILDAVFLVAGEAAGIRLVRTNRTFHDLYTAHRFSILRRRLLYRLSLQPASIRPSPLDLQVLANYCSVLRDDSEKSIKAVLRVATVTDVYNRDCIPEMEVSVDFTRMPQDMQCGDLVNNPWCCRQMERMIRTERKMAYLAYRVGEPNDGPLRGFLAQSIVQVNGKSGFLHTTSYRSDISWPVDRSLYWKFMRILEEEMVGILPESFHAITKGESFYQFYEGFPKRKLKKRLRKRLRQKMARQFLDVSGIDYLHDFLSGSRTRRREIMDKFMQYHRDSAQDEF